MNQVITTPNQHQQYNSSNNYWLFYDTKNNNKVVCLMGVLFHLEDLRYTQDHVKTHLLGQIDQVTFDVLNASCASTALMTFFDPDKDEVYYRKMYVELGDKTFYDIETECLVSLDNIIRLKIFCKDDNENPADDVQIVTFKNMNLLDELETKTKVLINSDDIRKIDINNGDEVNVELVSNTKFNFRFKAIIPTVNNLWLTMYISARKISNEEILVMTDSFKEASTQVRYITPFTNPYINNQLNTQE
jgi:hypothetical protein